MRYLLFLPTLALLSACHSFDSSEIISPTDYQIQSVSFNLSKDVIPTNMVAQKVKNHQEFTLVGARLQQGNENFVALWLFNAQDSADIRSINQSAEAFSSFPHLTAISAPDEANNLIAFLRRD
ncbi:hypothetical protein [Tunicatimonas pelagia]|uniref:hypothetical protein n=1 Tax=Tunicatimonas pelagia TaxID=931531 RepID=UPI002665F7FC|nr:hypothetical protein [Tunicatimonas pelagia]WKN43719.1 hypothetical protein P0M28_01880 [Tunicatimonas pelagia]